MTDLWTVSLPIVSAASCLHELLEEIETIMGKATEERVKGQQLVAESRRNQLEFIRTELQIADTLLDVARTEERIGDEEGACTAREKAEVALKTVARQLDRAKSHGASVEDLEAKLEKLNRVLLNSANHPRKRAA